MINESLELLKRILALTEENKQNLMRINRLHMQDDPLSPSSLSSVRELTEVYWSSVDEALRILRKTLRDLSEATGINYQTISGWRVHGRLPDLYSAVLISQFLSIPIDLLCTRSKEESR